MGRRPTSRAAADAPRALARRFRALCFDIYLPEWLAPQNKLIFGLLYLFGILITAALWAVELPPAN